MNWYLEALKKYAVFSGRARRKEYWYFVLFNIIIGLVLGFIEGTLGLFSDSQGSILFLLYSLAVLLPEIGVSVRWLHDTRRSGWWLLIGFVPIVGQIVLLVLMVLDSHADENQYGPNPKNS